MKNRFYVDKYTKAPLMCLSENPPESAYKGMTTTSFKAAKDFSELGIYSEYDDEWDFKEIPRHGLRAIEKISKQIERLDEVFAPFLQEAIGEYNYNVSDFLLSEEYKERERLNILFYYMTGQKIVLQADLKDRVYKKALLKKQYDFVHLRARWNRTKDEETEKRAKEILKDVLSELDISVMNTREQALAFVEESRKIMRSYADIHEQNELTPRRLNDLKNMLIIYITERKKMEELQRYAELAVASACSNPPYKAKLCQVKDLLGTDIVFDPTRGYNIRHAKDGEVKQVMTVGQGYNRLVVVALDGRLLRNNDWVIVDLDAKGSKLELDFSLFYDPDEYEITVNAHELAKAVNPLITKLFGEDAIEIGGKD